jgi:tRNA A37 threonylcarbamoyladenosine modification protein TsaB
METLMSEKVAAPGTAIERISGPCIYVGSGARLYREEILAAKGDSARIAPAFQQHPDPATLAWLTAKRLETHGQSAADLRPLYLRKSDAQIQRKCLTPKDRSDIVEKL